jgi:hypothetical protein
MRGRRTDLAGIMRRDGGCHADRDAGGAIGQQIRKGRGQNERFLILVVVGRAEIHCVVADIGEQGGCHLGHARFGIAHRGRVIAIHIAEIALAFHQRIAHREILRQPHECIVDRGIAMRMELAHHVTHHTGAFLEPRRRIEPQLLHGVDQPTMHRLQPITHIRQAARHDGGQRIGEIALGQGVAEVGVLDVFHGRGSNRGGGCRKRREAKSSFLKKRSKRLLCAVADSNNKSFLILFFKNGLLS